MGLRAGLYASLLANAHQAGRTPILLRDSHPSRASAVSGISPGSTRQRTRTTTVVQTDCVCMRSNAVASTARPGLAHVLCRRPVGSTGRHGRGHQDHGDNDDPDMGSTRGQAGLRKSGQFGEEVTWVGGTLACSPGRIKVTVEEAIVVAKISGTQSGPNKE